MSEREPGQAKLREQIMELYALGSTPEQISRRVPASAKAIAHTIRNATELPKNFYEAQLVACRAAMDKRFGRMSRRRKHAAIRAAKEGA